jgi:hypothetical protein
MWAGEFDCVFWLSILYLQDCLTNDNWPNVPQVLCNYYARYFEPSLDINRLRLLTESGSTKLHCRLCFILDGYDEILDDPANNNASRSVRNFIESLLKHPEYFVIMTSRPNAVEPSMKSYFSRQLENVGLNSDKVGDYIKRYFEKVSKIDLIESLNHFVKKQPNVRNLVRTPINLYILCYVWCQGDERQLLQHSDQMTLTHLYTRMIIVLMRRYCNKILHMNPLNLLNLHDSEIYKAAKEPIETLEYLAFKAMKSQTVLISTPKRDALSSDISFDQLDHARKTGLLKSFGNGVLFMGREHYFVHLTFQEYFAACHVAKHWQPRMRKCRTKLLNSSKSTNIVVCMSE